MKLTKEERTKEEQKKEIIFNALNDGWEVKKIKDKDNCSSYSFKKKRIKVNDQK
jgi:hypothetical protein